MLGFFRINDPYRLLILFLAVSLLRLPYLIGSDPLVYEIDWLLIGENLNSGKILYKDLVTPIAPLAAWTYMIINFVFGKSILVLHILSILLVTYQFSLFNNIMLRNKAYNENSYIPALIYALMTFTFYDFFTLSPVLISLTFILLVLDNIYLRIEQKLQDITILKTGIFMGLAVLFYLPSIFFLAATLLSFALLTSLVVRRYLLFLYGFAFAFIIVLTYFYWQNALDGFFVQWIKFNFFDSLNPVLDLQSIIVVSALPTLIFIFSLYKTFTATRFTNYQLRVQQVMLIMFLAALGSWWISEQQAPYELLVFVPFFAFFITHFILQFRLKIRAEIFTLFFSLALIAVNYSIFYKNNFLHRIGDFSKLEAQPTIYQESVSNKAAMILGGNVTLYHSASDIATRFYEPKLSQLLLEEMTEKQRMMILYEDLEKYQPDVILDLSGYFDKVYTSSNLSGLSYYKKTRNLYLRSSE